MTPSELEAAIAVYEKRLAEQPRQVSVQLALADCLHRLNRHDAATVHLLAGLKIDNTHSALWSYLGRVRLALRDVVGARQAYQTAISYDERNDSALAGYARLLAMSGELPQANAYFRQALTLRLERPSSVIPVLPRSDFSRPENIALLWRTLAQLAAAGVHAFATSGTLLGLEREGQLLSFDKDIDLALPVQEMNTAQECMLANGWCYAPNEMRLSNPVAFYHLEERVTVDLIALLREPDSGITISGFWRDDVPQSWWRIVEYPKGLSLRLVEGGAGPYWSLENPHLVLEAFYGPNWRVPDPDFDTVIAAYNQRGFSVITQCYALYRIYGRWQEGQLSKALATTRHSLRKQPDEILLQQVAGHLQAALANSSLSGV